MEASATAVPLPQFDRWLRMAYAMRPVLVFQGITGCGSLETIVDLTAICHEGLQDGVPFVPDN